MSPVSSTKCSDAGARVQAPFTLSDTRTSPGAWYWENHPTSKSPWATGDVSVTVVVDIGAVENAAPWTKVGAAAAGPARAAPRNRAKPGYRMGHRIRHAEPENNPTLGGRTNAARDKGHGCVVAVTVPSHGVAAIAIEIREHRVEHAAGDGLDAPANHLEPRCRPAWRMHDARVAVADGSVHGHEPRHRHRAAIDGEALLLPVDLGQQAPEVRLARGGIEDLPDEHEAVGQRHAPIMYAASEVDK